MYTHHLFSSVNSQLLIHCRLKVVLNNATAVDDDHFCKGNTHSVTVMLTLQALYHATAIDGDHFCKTITYFVTVMLTLEVLHTAVMLTLQELHTAVMPAACM